VKLWVGVEITEREGISDDDRERNSKDKMPEVNLHTTGTYYNDNISGSVLCIEQYLEVPTGESRYEFIDKE